MRYAEAFQRLGYALSLPRQHWSSSHGNGVCLSLWRTEIDWKNLKFDTLEDAGPPETWAAAGANKRLVDLVLAVKKFDGWIDVVVVDGVPGEGVDEAQPWKPADRKGARWRITRLDESTGHFRAEIVT